MYVLRGGYYLQFQAFAEHFKVNFPRLGKVLRPPRSIVMAHTDDRGSQSHFGRLEPKDSQDF